MQFNKWKLGAWTGLGVNEPMRLSPFLNNSPGRWASEGQSCLFPDAEGGERSILKRLSLSLEVELPSYTSCLFRWYSQTKIHPVSLFSKNKPSSQKQSLCSAKSKPKGLLASHSPTHRSLKMSVSEWGEGGVTTVFLSVSTKLINRPLFLIWRLLNQGSTIWLKYLQIIVAGLQATL